MRHTAHGSKRKSLTVLTAAASTAVAMSVFGVWQANAVHDAGFSLQGDINGATVDWNNVLTTDSAGDVTPAATLPTGYVAAAARADYVLPDTTTYATGSKDTLPINVAGASDWQCTKSNNVGDKVDLLNAYSTAAIPTSGAYANHLLIFFGSEISSPNGDRNAGVWLLQDDSADCSTTAGGAQDWTGHHRIGDLLIVSAFTNGGANANVTVYKWVNPNVTDPTANADVGGSLQLAFGNANLATQKCGSATDDRACAIENSSTLSPAWNHPDKDGGALNVNEFYEGGIDLTAIGLNGCFSTVVANSRSSQSPTATLFDYVRAPFNTCGSLKVHKFVDNNANGSQDTGEVNGAWSFTVTGPSPSTATVCSGTTDSTTGDMTCPNLQSGTYTVTETQIGGYYNTRAGTTVAVNAGSTVTATGVVGQGGTSTVNFGNICYVDKTFQITNVPTGTDAPSSVTVQYAKNDAGNIDGPFTNLALVNQGNGTWSASVNDTFLQTDTIDWRWYINGDSANFKNKDNDESLQAANPTHPNTAPRDAGCSVTNSDQFTTTPITGHKYKDVNANGVLDSGDLDGQGFVVNIYRASDTTFSTVVATATSNASGNFTFSPQLPPGSYVAKEVQNTGWRQTEPAAVNNQPGTRSFSIALNQSSASVGEWGNTPLSNIAVTFTPQAVNPGTTTPSTQGQISCTPGSATQSGNSLTSNNLTIGTYTCTVVITDP